MGTTAQKLQKLLDSKAAIKAAIEAKTGGTAGDVMADYANQINSIPTPDYEVVNIKLTTNQGTDYGFASTSLGSYIYKEGDTPIYNVVVKVDGESASRIFSYTGLVISTIIAKDKKYTVSIEFRNRPIGYIAYSLPTFNADGYTAIAGNVRNIIGIFSCEKVTVKLVNELQKAVTGQNTTVTMGSNTTTGTTSDFVFGVPTGQEYTVSFSDRSGYDTPTSQTYTANQVTREITGVYKMQKLGVFILDGSSTMVQIKEWSASMGVIGIAVITSDCPFVVHPDGPCKALSWRNSNISSVGLTLYGDTGSASLDFKGLENTTKLLLLNDAKCPANICNSMTINDAVNQNCYLPALGELKAIMNNAALIKAALRTIGKLNVIKTDENIWSSSGTKNNTLYAYLSTGAWGTSSSITTSSTSYVIPIAELKSNN